MCIRDRHLGAHWEGSAVHEEWTGAYKDARARYAILKKRDTQQSHRSRAVRFELLEEGNANPKGFGVIAHLQNEEENGNAQRAIAGICPGRTNLPVLQLGVSTSPRDTCLDKRRGCSCNDLK